MRRLLSLINALRAVDRATLIILGIAAALSVARSTLLALLLEGGTVPEQVLCPLEERLPVAIARAKQHYFSVFPVYFCTSLPRLIQERCLVPCRVGVRLLLIDNGYLFVGVIRQRDKNSLLCVKSVHLMIALRQFADDIVDIALKGLVGLRSFRFRHVYLHVPLLEDHPVAKHFGCQILVEVPVGTFGVLGVANVVGNVSCAV